jgi:two-component system response regulator DesR
MVVADDSAAIRIELERMFFGLSGVRIIGVAADGPQAFWLATTLEPDVLVLDLNMPHASGLQVAQEIRKSNEAVTIIIISADSIPLIQELCLKSGANHFLAKSQLNQLVGICETLSRERSIAR